MTLSITLTALVGSIYFTISIAIQRLVAMYFPFRRFSQSNRKMALVILCVVSIAALPVQFCKFIEYPAINDSVVGDCGIDLKEYSEGYVGVNFQYVEYYVQWPFFLMIIAIPFFLLLILNCAIIVKVVILLNKNGSFV